jgi:hypothetical protein
VIARGDLTEALKLADRLQPEARAAAYQGIIAQVARVSPQKARSLLEQMAKSAKLNDDSSMVALGRATIRVVHAVGPTDPAAAALARSMPEMEWGAPQIPLALAAAARYQKGAEAAAVRREAVLAASGRTNRGDAALVLAAVAAQCAGAGGPPQVAQSLWQQARSLQESGGTLYSEEGFAFYASVFDPAYARIVAERAYDRYGNRPPGSESKYQMATAALALTPADPDRAVALLNAIPPDKEKGQGYRFSDLYIRAEMAQLLLLPPAQRRTIVFDTMRGAEEGWWRGL